MPSNAHLDKARRRYHFDREPLARPTLNPPEIASKRARDLGFDAKEAFLFLGTFHQIRRETFAGLDTEPLLRAFEANGDDLAVAAYHEALASTRPLDWAQ